MSNLTLRTTTTATDPGSTTAKGSALTHGEMDSNLILLNNEKLGNVSEDTTPQLGGNLDCQGNEIQNAVLEDYAETVYALGSTDTPTLNVSNGNVQTVTISSGLTIPVFSDAATGQSMTLIVSGSGSASGTANHKFAGGSKTLTNDSVVSIFYDGTTYWTSVATDFQV